jgi:hypothetical protein
MYNSSNTTAILLSSFVNCTAIGPCVDVVSTSFLLVYDVTLAMMDDPMPLPSMMIILLLFLGIMRIMKLKMCHR